LCANRPINYQITRLLDYQIHLREQSWKARLADGEAREYLARVSEADDRSLVRQLLLDHAHCRLQLLEVALLLLNEHATGYIEELQQELLAIAPASANSGIVVIRIAATCALLSASPARNSDWFSTTPRTE